MDNICGTVSCSPPITTTGDFKTDFKDVAVILFEQLDDSLLQDDDRIDAAFAELACSLISQLWQDGNSEFICRYLLPGLIKISLVGNMVPQLTRLLSKMNNSVANGLLNLVRTLLENCTVVSYCLCELERSIFFFICSGSHCD